MILNNNKRISQIRDVAVMVDHRGNIKEYEKLEDQELKKVKYED